MAKCTRCEGCGKIADTEEGEPWIAWACLPLGSDAAVRMGIVKPIECPQCHGIGLDRAHGSNKGVCDRMEVSLDKLTKLLKELEDSRTDRMELWFDPQTPKDYPVEFARIREVNNGPFGPLMRERESPYIVRGVVVMRNMEEHPREALVTLVDLRKG